MLFHRLNGLAHRSVPRATFRLHGASFRLEGLVLVASIEILGVNRSVCGSILARATSDQDIALDGGGKYTKQRIVDVLSDEAGESDVRSRMESGIRGHTSHGQGRGRCGMACGRNASRTRRQDGPNGVCGDVSTMR